MELQVGGHLAATAVTPIDFDTTNQVQSLIDQLEASINSHIQSASQSVDEKEASQLRQLLHEHIRLRLPELIHVNTTVKGTTWVQLQDRNMSAQQPVDAALLKETIETQDSAFSFSSANGNQRLEKLPLFSEQVGRRVKQDLSTKEREMALLRQEHTSRKARSRLGDKGLGVPMDLSATLAKVDGMLDTASRSIRGNCEKASTATMAAADINMMYPQPVLTVNPLLEERNMQQGYDNTSLSAVDEGIADSIESVLSSNEDKRLLQC